LILPVLASHVARMTGMYHCVQLLVEMGVSWTFCLGWPQTMILLISTSQVARIIGMSHQHPAGHFIFLMKKSFESTIFKWFVSLGQGKREILNYSVFQIYLLFSRFCCFSSYL
jgi:hypothetical protein